MAFQGRTLERGKSPHTSTPISYCDIIKSVRIFEGYTVDFEDTRYNYGEERFITIWERVKKMSDDEIEQSALNDPDNQPIIKGFSGLKRKISMRSG